MAVSIDTYLKNLSYDKFFLKKSSIEIESIRKSIESLFYSLNRYLEGKIKRQFIFGSYDRNTILPRSVDENSDIDVMVVYNHTEYERTPETYREWLKSFADTYYKNRYGSTVVRSFPTVTIRLGNIHYDLVPAKEESDYWGNSKLYIPDKSSEWQSTDPDDVKTALTKKNTEYGGIVRPIVRLLKAWNCTSGYPFDSYALELKITGMNFYGDNVQSGLFWAVKQFSTSWSDTQLKRTKVDSLKYNLGKCEECLDSDDLLGAKRWLHRVIPS